ncbi:MAG: hypothetical protein ACRYF4_10870 [Janthinobacterium lividum]
MARDFTQNSEQYLAHIDAEIARLQQLRTQVTGAVKGDKELAPQKARKGMSAEGRLRVAAAQKARWAKLKKTTPKVAKKTPSKKAVAE